MHENQISDRVIGAAFKVHTALGPGLLESVYEAVLAYELRKYGLHVETQKPIPVIYDEVKLDLGFRLDLLVENKVVVELKSIETLLPVHHKQLLTYLKLAYYKLGLLMNFNTALLRSQLSRLVNGL
ncbi:GxxExxY protein [Hymenobacter aerilatus]|uniref:GxxExxY protein n=1 Tax=Hymenobacter aerilatus TaxID=2932251 RepID=A0A8T9SUB1_9BACT|nr:GxxExxY protein [Hymenobacter aerilatus]UOR05752.1 GxxExxY protein [Hymenobacter aerilatus]